MERIKDGKAVREGFIYDSENNSDWMSVDELGAWAQSNRDQVRVDNSLIFFYDRVLNAV